MPYLTFNSTTAPALALRLLLIAVLLFLPLMNSSSSETGVLKHVNLNAPRVMEELRSKNKVHHEKIQKIIDGLRKQELDKVESWISASFGARDVEYTDILLVTSPPQKRLSFTLGDTRYVSTVTLEKGRTAIYPVRSR